eukprot:4091935-Prymnesium_polylepis.2
MEYLVQFCTSMQSCTAVRQERARHKVGGYVAFSSPPRTARPAHTLPSISQPSSSRGSRRGP